MNKYISGKLTTPSKFSTDMQNKNNVKNYIQESSGSSTSDPLKDLTPALAHTPNGPTTINIDQMSNGPSISMVASPIRAVDHATMGSTSTGGYPVNQMFGSQNITSANEAMNSSNPRSFRSYCINSCFVRSITGCIIMLMSAICLTIATELGKSTFLTQNSMKTEGSFPIISRHYESRAVLASVYCITASYVMLFPVYVLVKFVCSCGKLKAGELFRYVFHYGIIFRNTHFIHIHNQ